MTKIKILMVCLGNICRSPLAEGILQKKINSYKILVDSAGTGNWHIGKPPDKRSIKVAEENGVNISNQRARQFKIADFDTFDYIYVMDKNNYNDIISLATNKQDKNKVKLILNELYPNQDKEVPDPYYGGENGFQKVYEMLNKACNIIADKYSND